MLKQKFRLQRLRLERTKFFVLSGGMCVEMWTNRKCSADLSRVNFSGQKCHGLFTNRIIQSLHSIDNNKQARFGWWCWSLTPFTPFLSLSSMKSERYSGDFWFKLMKYSKSEEIICLKSLSSLNDSCRKWSKRSFKSSKLWNGKQGTMKNTSFTTVIVIFRSVCNINFRSVCNINLHVVTLSYTYT